MSEEKYVVTVKYNDVETMMSVWDNVLLAALHADVLRKDGYENVTIKQYKETDK